jgi:anti-anti-sigma factor
VPDPALAFPPKPSVSTERLGAGALLVRVSGDLDLALAPRLAGAIADGIARGDRHLALDFSRATFLDCASVGVLVRAVAPLRDDPDASVALVGTCAAVQRTLRLLALDALFETVGGVEGWRRAAGAKTSRVMNLDA